MKIKYALFIALCTISSMVHSDERSIRFSLSGGTESDYAKTAEIIYHRFSKIKPSIFNSVDYEVNNQEFEIKFSGWFPSNKAIEFFSCYECNVVIKLAEDRSKILITEKDIIDANVIEQNGETRLALMVNSSQAKNLLELTKNNVGKTALFDWNNIPYRKIVITSPLEKYVSVSTGSKEEAVLISVILKEKKIPNGIKVSINNGQTKT